MSRMDVAQSETVEIGPGNLKLTFSTTSGQLTRISNSKTGVRSPLVYITVNFCISVAFM